MEHQVRRGGGVPEAVKDGGEEERELRQQLRLTAA